MDYMIGKRIRLNRKAAGLTQAELAQKLGIPPQSIGQWERGERQPKLDTLLRIASALDTPLEELVDLEGALAADRAEKTHVVVPNDILADVLDILDVFVSVKQQARRRIVEYAQELVLIDKYRKKNPEED